MKLIARFAAVLVMLTAVGLAENLPDSPGSMMESSSSSVRSMAVTAAVVRPTPAITEKKVADKKFLSLTALSTAATFADSYTTTWAIQNWQNTPAGESRPCNAETQSPWLYGTHPTYARVYTVAAGKSVGSALLSYYLKKRHSRFWQLPLTVNTAFSLQGMAHNVASCR
ncbi:MAG: hypothetical protein JST79_05820 [Acidobacteria bacterium]|nr:hypothetical protein [Acidobacteriota bacterium]